MVISAGGHKRVSPENYGHDRIIIHSFWIGITVSLIIALVFAYMDTLAEYLTFSELFPKPNGTVINHTTTATRESVREISIPINTNTNTTGQDQVNFIGNVSVPISVNKTTPVPK